MNRFDGVGVIRNQLSYDSLKLDDFSDRVESLLDKGSWNKGDIVDLFFNLLPEFAHKETGKYLDDRM